MALRRQGKGLAVTGRMTAQAGAGEPADDSDPRLAMAAPIGAGPGRAGTLGLLLCGYFPMIGLFAIGVDLPRIAAAFAELPHSALLAQLAIGVTGLSFALSAPLIGRLIERHGYARIYQVSLAGFAALGLLPMLLDDLLVILASRVVMGIAVAGCTTAGMTGLGTLPPAVRARMFGWNAVLTSLGALAIFPITGALVDLGWRMAFLINLFALLVLPLALCLPRPTAPPRDGQEAVSRPPRGSSGASPGLVAVSAFVGLVMFVGPMFAPFYLASIGVTDPKLVALPLSVMSLGSLLMTSNYGRLHARFGTTAIFGAILLLVGCGLIWAGSSLTLPLFAAGMFVTACGTAMFVPNMGAAISATSTGSPGRGIGIAMSAMFVMQAVLPFLGEALRALLGARGVFVALGVVAILLAIGFVLAARRQTASGRAA